MYGYDPNGYPGPPGGRWQPPLQNNPLALASFVLSLVSFFCFSILAIPGLIVGIVALTQFRHTPYANRWMAVVGIAISGVHVFVLAVVLIVVLGAVVMENLWWYI